MILKKNKICIFIIPPIQKIIYHPTRSEFSDKIQPAREGPKNPGTLPKVFVIPNKIPLKAGAISM